jgi:hypothetical protein
MLIATVCRWPIFTIGLCLLPGLAAAQNQRFPMVGDWVDAQDNEPLIIRAKKNPADQAVFDLSFIYPKWGGASLAPSIGAGSNLRIDFVAGNTCYYALSINQNKSRLYLAKRLGSGCRAKYTFARTQ